LLPLVPGSSQPGRTSRDAARPARSRVSAGGQASGFTRILAVSQTEKDAEENQRQSKQQSRGARSRAGDGAKLIEPAWGATKRTCLLSCFSHRGVDAFRVRSTFAEREGARRRERKVERQGREEVGPRRHQLAAEQQDAEETGFQKESRKALICK
jgi:hypothetical protein